MGMRPFPWRRRLRRLRAGRCGLLLLVLCTFLLTFLALECARRELRPQRAAEEDRLPPQPRTLAGRLAYAVVVTNEDYVDGALVLGDSLTQHSRHVADGLAELVLLFPQGRLSAESRGRLRCAGWRRVMEVSDLSAYAPRARLRDTFTKLHVFNLTEYARVAMLDGDMLMLRSPDKVFDTELPNEHHVGAIGSQTRNYFQTGMMLLIPSRAVFLALLHSLKTDRRQQGYYGRDGHLVRGYFTSQYVILDHFLSIHIHPADPVIEKAIGLHYRGAWKPWHNREDPPPASRHLTADAPVQELGAPYRLWWEAYERLHVRCLAPRDAVGSPTRDANAPAGYDPAESVWLMRHTAHSYMQWMAQKEEQQRNTTLTGLRVVESEEGASCDEACGRAGLQCIEKALSFLRVNSAASLEVVFLCMHTSREIPMPYYPSFNVRTLTCHVNSMYGKHERPTCGAKAPLHRRLCTCLEAAAYRGANLASAPAASEVPRQAPPESAPPHTEGPRAAEASGDAAACSEWVPASTHAAAAVLRSRRCASFLSQWNDVEAVPRQRDARTIKVRLRYKNGAAAIVKLEQLSFPLEPHAEYGAYAASLLLGIGMVPPTRLLHLPASVLREALLTGVNATERRFLEEELPWLRRAAAAAEALTASAQLWLPDDVVAFGDAAPPLTRRRFDAWLQAKSSHSTNSTGDRVMFDVAIMRFFDYVIANEDRTFTHNAHVLAKGNTTQVVLLDHGKSLHSDSAEVQPNPLLPPRDFHPDEEAAKPAPMCRLPGFVLRQAMRLSSKRYEPLHSLLARGEAGGSGRIEGSETLAGQLLRAAPSNNVTWRLPEKSILAVQLRLETALAHFAKCAEVFGLSHVIG
ncbi:putative glycogenin glucosyltransferase [Trypanosoma conorhini]|uniref:Putative glycogenin glucosyltransferase n=1 Tax=Trypanosoma conorhini TaxID=83891 RepID=A0A3R7RTI3_9TRYP|nr:putative glycogenin glucosyltransferase [Trypanosoma conorhini]RNF12605.1 putative glycogenin glucosyltransferase [Trypanosoma conorhini]